MIRFLLNWAIVNIISYSAYCGGMTWKALKGVNKEYEVMSLGPKVRKKP